MSDRNAERATGFLVRVEDSGVIRLTWDAGRRIDQGLAQKAMLAVDTLAGGRPCPLYVEIGGVLGLTRDGREAFARPWSASRLALVGRFPVDRIFVGLPLGASPLRVPSRFFTSERAALDWLLDSASVA